MDISILFKKNSFRRSVLLSFISLIISNFVFSQDVNNYGRTYSDTLPDKFKLDVPQLREYIYSTIPAKLKTGNNERRSFRFADQNAINISELLGNGEVYSDWPSLENYVNEIFRKIIPDEFKNDSTIHAYIIRDGNYNAFMTPSGKTFINVGLFAEISDEATLAGILAHEFSHYYLKHSVYTFLESEAGTFDEGIIFANKARSKYSIKNELQADSMAMQLLYRSGYNISGLISSFEGMRRLEKNELKRSPEWKLEATTHPLSVDRLRQLNDFYTLHKNEPGKFFLIDETSFEKFKEEAKPEILKCLFNDFQYYPCIEKAFQFHLFDPDNSVYVYYLMESIRKNCYLNPKLWNELFITNRYYDSLSVNNRSHKEKMKDNLFKKFDLTILPINPVDGRKLKAKFYWRDQPKFTTYEEAFVFFYKVGEALNNPECILSNALSFSRDKALRNKLLEKYLSFNNIQHREYAERLLSGNIIKDLKKQRLVVFDNFDAYIMQGKENVPIKVPYSKESIVHVLFDSVMVSRKNETPLFLKNLRNYSLNDYIMLSEMERFSMTSLISQGQKTELHILDPAYWEAFNKFKVNEIEFINCRYSEVMSKDNTFESYKKYSDLDYKLIFGKRSSMRFFETFISSVREIDGALMKFRYYGGENELKAKDENFGHFTKIIKRNLEEKEKRGIQEDGAYRNSNY